MENSIFFQILFFTLFYSEKYFSLVYNMYSSTSQSYSVLMQVLFMDVAEIILIFLKDRLISEWIQFCLFFLNIMVNHMMYGNWNSSFCYNVYRLLCNSSTFKRVEDNDYMIKNFSLLLYIWLIHCISKIFHFNEDISKHCKIWLMILCFCFPVMNIYIGLKTLIYG